MKALPCKAVELQAVILLGAELRDGHHQPLAPARVQRQRLQILRVY